MCIFISPYLIGHFKFPYSKPSCLAHGSCAFHSTSKTIWQSETSSVTIENLSYDGLNKQFYFSQTTKKAEDRELITLTQQLNNVRASGLCNVICHGLHWSKVATPAPDIDSQGRKLENWQCLTIPSLFLGKQKLSQNTQSKFSFMPYLTDCILWPSIPGCKGDWENKCLAFLYEAF